MADKARHAYGSRKNLAAAIESKAIDVYDILFLNGENETPTVGWIDKEGNPVILEDKVQIVRVEELPIVDGDENVVYIYNNEGYIWDAVNGQCVPLAKSTDLTVLETQVTELTTQMGTKVDATTVQNMIEEYSVEVVEF